VSEFVSEPVTALTTGDTRMLCGYITHEIVSESVTAHTTGDTHMLCGYMTHERAILSRSPPRVHTSATLCACALVGLWEHLTMAKAFSTLDHISLRYPKSRRAIRRDRVV